MLIKNAVASVVFGFGMLWSLAATAEIGTDRGAFYPNPDAWKELFADAALAEELENCHIVGVTLEGQANKGTTWTYKFRFDFEDSGIPNLRCQPAADFCDITAEVKSVGMIRSTEWSVSYEQTCKD